MNIEKVEKLVANLNDKKVIKLNQKAWPKSYIKMKTTIKTKQKKIILKRILKVYEKFSFLKNHGKCELATTEKRRICLVS